MGITIELPEWAEERNISIMAGMELLAYKRAHESILYIKKVRCDFCGWCCGEKFVKEIETGSDGKCAKLKQVGQNWECTPALDRPWRCCWYDPVLGEFPNAEKHCVVRYDEVEIE